MNAMYLIYVPVAALFVAFVVYAGLVMPFKEVGESLRDRRHPRGPNQPGDDLVRIRTEGERQESTQREKAAA
jgi:hypothetical protein